MKNITLSLFALMFSFVTLQAQDIPRSFMIGDHEEALEKVSIDYDINLLQVCENDPQKAYNVWSAMLDEMESYAEIAEYDLNGIKAWFRVLYDKDGTIDYIAYHLRPESKNIDTDAFAEFLAGFADYYKLPLTAKTKYNNYTGVQFPTFKKILENAKKGE